MGFLGGGAGGGGGGGGGPSPVPDDDDPFSRRRGARGDLGGGVNGRMTVGAPYMSSPLSGGDPSGTPSVWGGRASSGSRISSGTRRYGFVSGFGGRYGVPGAYGPDRPACPAASGA